MAGTEDPNGPAGGTPPGGQEPVGQEPPLPPAASPPSEPRHPGGEPAPAPPPPTAPTPDWRDKRIGEQQARIRDLRAQLEQFQRQAPNPAQPMPPPRQPYQGGPPDPAVVEREIQQRAAALAATQEFNRRCNETAEAGRLQYSDFDAKVSKLVGLVDGNDPVQVQNYNQFLSAAMETGEGSKLIYSLGGDLNEANRILGLSPLKMAVELTKLSARPVQEVSGAPRPINPAASQGVNNRSGIFSADDPNSDNLTTEEWMRRREEQVAERRRNGGR